MILINRPVFTFARLGPQWAACNEVSVIFCLFFIANRVFCNRCQYVTAQLLNSTEGLLQCGIGFLLLKTYFVYNWMHIACRELLGLLILTQPGWCTVRSPNAVIWACDFSPMFIGLIAINAAVSVPMRFGYGACVNCGPSVSARVKKVALPGELVEPRHQPEWYCSWANCGKRGTFA